MPSPEACADETDRELRAEIDRLRDVIRSAYEDMSIRDDAGAYMTLKHKCEKLDTKEG